MKRWIGISSFAFLVCFFAAPWRPAAQWLGNRLRPQIVFADALPTNPALAPPMPQSACLSEAPAGTHGITTCWTASVSSTVTGYNVYAGTTTGGPYTKQNTAPVSGTSFFYATPNLGGVKQFVVIRSFDGVAESVNSGELSLTAIGNPQPPTAPQGVAN